MFKFKISFILVKMLFNCWLLAHSVINSINPLLLLSIWPRNKAEPAEVSAKRIRQNNSLTLAVIHITSWSSDCNRVHRLQFSRALALPLSGLGPPRCKHWSMLSFASMNIKSGVIVLITEQKKNPTSHILFLLTHFESFSVMRRCPNFTAVLSAVIIQVNREIQRLHWTVPDHLWSSFGICNISNMQLTNSLLLRG